MTSMRTAVLYITDVAPTKALFKIANSHGIDLYVTSSSLGVDALIAKLQPFVAVITGSSQRFTEKVLSHASKLRVLAYAGASYDGYIDVEAATRYGIAVTTAPGANAKSVAEFTMGLILDATKHITQLANRTKQGQWTPIIVSTLNKTKLGILGMGAIGSEVARIARNGFEMDVHYFSRTRKTSIETKLGVHYVDYETLLTESDVLTLHIPLNANTQASIGAYEFSLMKSSAIVVNSARAWLIEPVALRAALEQNQIAYLATDVYYQEPVPKPEDDPYGILQLPDDKVLITPHNAYNTYDAQLNSFQLCIKSIKNILNGKPDHYLANPQYSNETGFITEQKGSENV